VVCQANVCVSSLRYVTPSNLFLQVDMGMGAGTLEPPIEIVNVYCRKS